MELAGLFNICVVSAMVFIEYGQQYGFLSTQPTTVAQTASVAPALRIVYYSVAQSPWSRLPDLS
jgi:hypothetical protein